VSCAPLQLVLGALGGKLEDYPAQGLGLGEAMATFNADAAETGMLESMNGTFAGPPPFPKGRSRGGPMITSHRSNDLSSPPPQGRS
jgi:hypothetical protein